ncbi:hypothetical protein F442_03858, partial [Phytophthora nicotianae P10297]
MPVNGPSINDLDARLSISSATSKAKDIEEGGYTGIKTPDTRPDEKVGEYEGGALRPGGMPNLLSRGSIGLLFQYAVVGLVYGLLPETIYPFMQ